MVSLHTATHPQSKLSAICSINRIHNRLTLSPFLVRRKKSWLQRTTNFQRFENVLSFP